ncbi:MAG: hypothetical protein WAL67_13545 [Candidatus Cybelea sp.]
MRFEDTLVATVDIALLTSCGSGSSTPATPLAFRQTPHATRYAASSCGCLYVANYANSTVTVYAADATGNVAPVRAIAGRRTKLDHLFGVAVGSGSTIYASNQNGAVTVYAAGANGNARPVQYIKGA